MTAHPSHPHLTPGHSSPEHSSPGPSNHEPSSNRAPSRAQEAQRGFHPVEWACELLGTGLLLLLGLSAVCLDFGSASPLAGLPMPARYLVTGLLFGGFGSLIALTPFGRRSGAHLNPIVTLAFWTQHKVHWHDLIGYLVAQFAGAVLGALAVRLLWQQQAVSVSVGTTQPGAGVPAWVAVLIEAGMSACLLLAILFMTSHRRTARFTPLLLWLVTATFVWQFARFTGTSMNPARSLGPALVAPELDGYWIYVVGPLVGMVVAVGVFSLSRGTEVLTTKLFHDPAYRSTMAATLPVAQRR